MARGHYEGSQCGSMGGGVMLLVAPTLEGSNLKGEEQVLSMRRFSREMR
jgi:hypothetical protein